MRKYLIVAPAWLGDLIMAQSLFRLIKECHPDAQVHVLAKAPYESILNAMNEVDRVIDLPFNHGELALGARRALGKRLISEGYTHSITLPNSWKSALVPYYAKVRVRTGYIGELRYRLLNDARKLDKAETPLLIQRFCALALDKESDLPAHLPKPKLRLSKVDLQAVIQSFDLDIRKPVLALCPGAAYGPAKQWPEEHYARVAKIYAERGYQIWLLGAKADAEVCSHIASEVGVNGLNFAGETNLAEAMALLALSERVLSNDSGLMHLACALSKKTVVVYGSTSPLFTPPLSNKASVVSLNVPCSPCFKRVCPLKKDKHMQCLKNLDPEAIVEALDQL